MKKEYDLSKAKVHKGPLVDKNNAKSMRSIRFDMEVIQWAQDESEKLGVGYQTFINMKLREAMEKPSLEARLEKIEKKLFSKHG